MNLEFRVWHNQEKRYGARADLDDHRIDYEFNGGFVNLEFAIKNPQWYKVEQWTGLKDKSGIKVFEGDVLEYSRCCPCDDEEWQETKKIGVVEWIQTLYGKKPGFEIVNDSRDYYGSWPAEEFINVAGNINENPEILEEW